MGHIGFAHYSDMTIWQLKCERDKIDAELRTRTNQPSPPEAEQQDSHSRESFERWLGKTYHSGAEWDEARNCYKEFAVHMAWQSWRSRPIETDQRDAELTEAASNALHALDAMPVNYATAEREALRSALQRCNATSSE